MKHVSMFVLGLLILSTSFTLFAQDYPLWHSDPTEQFSEYPTAVDNRSGITTSVGFHEEEFLLFDIGYSAYHGVPCMTCGQEGIFVNWREEGSGNTWTANVYVDGVFNNHVGAQSVPQVTMNQNKEVYISFTYRGEAFVKDANGNIVSFIGPGGGSNWDFAVVKFDDNGNYVWHFTEGGKDNDFITDLYFDDATARLGIAGYVEGNGVLPLAGGAALIRAITNPSTLGPGLEFGNPFAAVYEDVGVPSFFWALALDAPAYSGDVVMDQGGNTFLSGYLYSARRLAGIGINGNYLDGGINYEHFIVGIDHGGPGGTAPVWAEVYGTKHNELDMATDKYLRHSSLGINRNSGELFFAFNNTGSNTSSFFPNYGTEVCHIDPASGAIVNQTPVGFTTGGGASSWSVNYGSPTYNPNLVVDDNNQVHLSGNFLLTNNLGAPTDIGIAFDIIEIYGTTLDFSQTYASSVGYDQAVGWYTFTIDFAGSTYVSEYLNPSYVPNNPNKSYRKLPVYGTAYDENQPNLFYSALAFFRGELELDLSVNQGVVNNYSNLGSPQSDGFLVRTEVGNGFYAKPNDNNDVTQTTSDARSFTDLGATTWTPQPNPAVAGSVVVLQGLALQPDQVQLVDLTGRVLQTWQQPDLTTQGVQLSLLKDIVPGVYFLRSSKGEAQESASLVIR